MDIIFVIVCIKFINLYLSSYSTRITDRLKSNSFKFNNITIGSLNLQGGFTIKAKMKEFKSITDKCHIVGLQETWLENRKSIDMSGFEHFRSERVKGRKARRNSGGVLLFSKSTIAGGVERQTSSNKHFIWVRLDATFFKLNQGYISLLYLYSTLKFQLL